MYEIDYSLAWKLETTCPAIALYSWWVCVVSTQCRDYAWLINEMHMVRKRSQEFFTKGALLGRRVEILGRRPRARELGVLESAVFEGFLSEQWTPFRQLRDLGERRKLSQGGSGLIPDQRMYFRRTKSPENASNRHKCRFIPVSRVDSVLGVLAMFLGVIVPSE